MQAHLFAQEKPEPIDTDRPDQTEAASLVPKGMFQMETGAEFHQVSDHVTSFLAPTILCKYGVNENFELRLITEIQGDNVYGEKTSGLNPVLVGLKIRLADEKGIIPKTAFIGHLLLPDAASTDYKVAHPATEFRLAMENNITDKFYIGYNVGAEWDGDSPDATFVYTLTTGVEVTKKLRIFGEVYGFAPEGETGDLEFDAGGVFLITNNVAIDASGGFGITENAPDYFLSAGFSFRL